MPAATERIACAVTLAVCACGRQEPTSEQLQAAESAKTCVAAGWHKGRLDEMDNGEAKKACLADIEASGWSAERLAGWECLHPAKCYDVERGLKDGTIGVLPGCMSETALAPCEEIFAKLYGERFDSGRFPCALDQYFEPLEPPESCAKR